MNSHYDLIGDIHGHAEKLVRLLERMGYQKDGEGYSHPERKAIFLGDYIDRGPEIRRTLRIVRTMVEQGTARAILGNHEYNAVCYATPDGKGDWLRKHGEKEMKQHKETLDQFAANSEDWKNHLEWFKTLPFFLELDGLRAVHAGWDATAIKILQSHGRMTDEFLFKSVEKTTPAPEHAAVEFVLKAPEVRLPEGYNLKDREGHERQEIRFRWWETVKGRTYREISFPPNSLNDYPHPNELLDNPVPDERVKGLNPYGPEEPPLFFGHYWLDSKESPIPQASNIACLDFSAGKDGPVVAYRWDGEQKLNRTKFVTSRDS